MTPFIPHAVAVTILEIKSRKYVNAHKWRKFWEDFDPSPVALGKKRFLEEYSSLNQIEDET